MRCFTYTRISTIDQDLASQQQELRNYCKDNNIEIINEFEDIITGASKQNERLGFSQMTNALFLNPEIKLIICYEFSRLGRSFVNTHNIIKEFKEYGINVYFVKEKLNTLTDDTTELFTLNILSSIADYERSTIKIRTMRGRTYRVLNEQGVQSGSIVQFGYKKENNKHVIDEIEAETIKLIFEMYLNQDYSTTQLADYLNSLGTKTTYQKLTESEKIKVKDERFSRNEFKWSSSGVAKLLRKRIFIGYRTYKSKELPHNPNFQIIDEMTFNQVQEKLTSKQKSDSVLKFPNVLRKVIKCSCGYFYVLNKSNNPNNHHYVCSKRLQCKSPIIDIDILNNVVYFFFQNVVKDVNKLNDETQRLATHINSLELNNQGLEKIVETDRAKLKDLIKSVIGVSETEKEVTEEIKVEIISKIELNQRKIADNNIQITSYQNELNKLNKDDSEELKNPDVFKKLAKNYIKEIRIKKLEKNLLLKEIFPKLRHSHILHVTIDGGIYGYYECIVNYNHDFFLNLIGNCFDNEGDFIGGSVTEVLLPDPETGLAEKHEQLTKMYMKVNIPDVIRID